MAPFSSSTSLHYYYLFLLSLMVFQSSRLFVQCNNNKTELLIQVLLPLESPVYSDSSSLPAIRMALEEINSSPYLLQDYVLTYNMADTKCDSSIGSWRLIQSILNTSSPNDTKIIAFVGGGCSLATEPMAALTGNLYNIIQVSHSATSPALSDRRQYPLFFRLAPSETLHNEARFAFSNMYDWCRIANLYQTENIFSLSVIDFHDRFYSFLGTTCNDSSYQPQLFSFPGDPLIPLRQIKEQDFRIINGFFYEDKAVIVLCYAFHLQLISPNHVWILPGFYSNGWWEQADRMDWSLYSVNCTSSDIVKALNTILLLDFYPYLLDPNRRTFTGYTNATFFERYNELYQMTFPDSSPSITYPTLMYDTIWTLALAFNDTQHTLNISGVSLVDFMYSHRSNSPSMSTYTGSISSVNITNLLRDSLQRTNFLGVSGQVKFDDSGTRQTVTSISQYQVRNGFVNKVDLAIYDYNIDGLNISYLNNPPIWKLGYPPPDRSMPESTLLTPPLIYTMDSIITVGILIAVTFLIFNIITIRKPLIANSAPLINSAITVGCIVMMCSSILLGIDSGTPQVTNGHRTNVLDDIDEQGKNRYAIICTARLWLLTIGFTLSFGALFAKTFLSYSIHLNEKKKEQPLKMWHFLIIIVIQLVIDVLLLCIWTGFFPFSHYIDEMNDQASNTITKHEKCDCANYSYLIITLCVYKGLLVVFGLFLAYESRNVKYYYINDSRFVSISMYIVVILIGISAPLSLVLADRYIIDAAYVVAVIMIVTACVSCLLILYVPKFVYMSKGADTMIVRTKAELFSPVDNLKLGYQEEIEDPENKPVKLTEIERRKESYTHSTCNAAITTESATSTSDNSSPALNSNKSPDERHTNNGDTTNTTSAGRASSIVGNSVITSTTAHDMISASLGTPTTPTSIATEMTMMLQDESFNLNSLTPSPPNGGHYSCNDSFTAATGNNMNLYSRGSELSTATNASFLSTNDSKTQLLPARTSPSPISFNSAFNSERRTSMKTPNSAASIASGGDKKIRFSFVDDRSSSPVGATTVNAEDILSEDEEEEEEEEGEGEKTIVHLESPC